MKTTSQFVRVLAFAVGAAGLCLASGIRAGEVDVAAAKAFAKENTCFRCHGVEKDKDGPAFTNIAAKFKGTADAEAKLIRHLTSGEKAKFPDGHEEPHMTLKPGDEGEIKNLVAWILSL